MARSKVRAKINQKVAISNPDKVLCPRGQFTKGDVVEYCRRVARFLLPHFRNQPVTLKRYPDGVHGAAFYEKDTPGFTPEWVKTFRARVAKTDRTSITF